MNAWRWRVNFARRGKQHAKTFYDLKHGGAEQALAAAITWRDRTLAKTKILMRISAHRGRRFRLIVDGISD